MKHRFLKTLAAVLLTAPAQLIAQDVSPDYEAFVKMKENGVEFTVLKQEYDKLLTAYDNGRRGPAFERDLAKIGNMLKEKETAKKVADRYIAGLDKKAMFTQENLEFISEFTKSSTDKGFSLLMNNAAKVNAITRKHFAQDRVNYIIYVEKLKASVENKDHPANWDSLAQTVRHYGAFGEEMLLKAKLYDLWNKKDFDRLIPVAKQFLPKYSDGEGALNINNLAWDVFLHRTSKEELNMALSWSRLAVSLEPKEANWLDTYANLLYKLGRTKEAIECQQRVVAMQPTVQDFSVNLAKMKAGEPTWPKQ